MSETLRVTAKMDFSPQDRSGSTRLALCDDASRALGIVVVGQELS